MIKPTINTTSVFKPVEFHTPESFLTAQESVKLNKLGFKIAEMANNISAKIEIKFKVVIKPKPKYMPRFLYNWLIKELIYIKRKDNIL
jgi:hypothetical protein